MRERESGETKIGVWRSHFSSKIYSAKIVLPPVCNFRTFKRLFIFGEDYNLVIEKNYEAILSACKIITNISNYSPRKLQSSD